MNQRWVSTLHLYTFFFCHTREKLLFICCFFVSVWLLHILSLSYCGLYHHLMSSVFVVFGFCIPSMSGQIQYTLLNPSVCTAGFLGTLFIILARQKDCPLQTKQHLWWFVSNVWKRFMYFRQPHPYCNCLACETDRNWHHIRL